MRRRRAPIVAWLLIWVSMGAVIQRKAAAQDTVSTSLAFEVSTVRPNNSGTRSSNLNFETDAIRSVNLPLIFLLQYAYNLNAGSSDQIIGAPAWLSSVPFDITAKMDDETSSRISKMPNEERDATLRLMIRELLADRFKLKIHHESKELAVFALKVVRDGPKLTSAVAPPIVPPKPRRPDDWTGLHNRDGLMQGRDASMKMLVDALSWKPEVGGRLVVDQTGLQGNYNFALRWTPDSGRSAADNPGESGPSLFTALQEQFGLKLESKKAPVDCIVIDHVEQPTPN
jgi:uncharacterized protein (TIGR03435 family)